MSPRDLRPGDPRHWIGAAFLALFALLLFTRLGHYALWDDEANTALFAQGVWATGDTSAVVGHNVVAYRGGIELDGLANRLIPPLQYYWAAPWVGLLGASAWAARLPFALVGWLCAAFVVWWLWRARASARVWAWVALGLACNVSLLLFLRQARYQALALFLGLLLVYAYVEFDGRRRTLALLCAAASLLMATHYLVYAGLGVALALDYLLFGRGGRLSWRALLVLAVTQLATAALLLPRWHLFTRVLQDGSSDKLTLLGWHFRDMNASEFMPVAVLAAAPLVYFLAGRRDPWLLRIPIAIVAFTAAVTAFSPQATAATTSADIRYLVAVIPAGVFLTVRLIEALPRIPVLARHALAVLCLATTVVHVTPPLRVTLASYLGELAQPQRSPYGAAAQWLRERVRAGQSVYVRPDYAVYPLMFHAPHALYAWQFSAAQKASFPGLPDIHFEALEFPDYLVAFGAAVTDMRRGVNTLATRGVHYKAVATLPVPGFDRTRPELHLRAFRDRPLLQPDTDAIYVFELTRR